MSPPSPNPPKTILFVDGEPARRQSLSLLLRASGYRLIVAGATDDALQKALTFTGPIHLLLANVEMPGMTGIELARQLNKQRPDMRILLLSGLNSGMLVLNESWQFLPTPFAAAMLTARIRETLKDPSPTVQKPSSSQDPSTPRPNLTKREIEVIKLIAAGNSTKQVAVILGIAFKTSVGHRSRLMKKLGIHDSATLVRYAIRAGLVDW